MAARTRRDVEVTLHDLVVPSLQSRQQTGHLLLAGLLWPRVNIANRSCEKEISLQQGRADWQQADWCRKILFKESVDNTFGLELSLSCPLSRAQLQEFSRYLAGNIIKLGAEVVDDALPFPGGDAAALPLLYASKSLLQTKKPEIIVRGTCAISLSELPEEGTQLLEVPLFSERELVRRRREGGHRDHVRYTRETLLAVGAPDGLARIQLRSL
ncbi:MAG: hypothetical protein GX902_01180 [Lentisphaerae bacterium]|nr:hypothetical protein [Lentisphaerota bacterium]